MDTTETLGSFIRYQLQQKVPGSTSKRWTQRSLAKYCGVHTDTVNNWIHDRTRPSRWNIRQLIEVFQLSNADRTLILALYDAFGTRKERCLIFTPEWISNALFEECLICMKNGPAQGDDYYLNRVNAINTNPAFTSISDGFEFFTLDHQLAQNDFETLQIDRIGDLGCIRDKNLKIVVSPFHTASLVLLTFMNRHFDLNLTIDNSFSNSSEIAQAISSGYFDSDFSGFSVSLGSFGGLARKHFDPLSSASQFLAATLSPGLSYGTVQHQNVANDDRPIYAGLKHFHSGTHLIFNQMYCDSELIHIPPYSSWDALNSSNDNLNVIIGFPYWKIYTSTNQCVLKNDPHRLIYDTVLCLRKGLVYDPLFFNVFITAFKLSWHLLKHDSFLIKRTLDQIVTTEFVDQLRRIGGLPTTIGDYI